MVLLTLFLETPVFPTVVQPYIFHTNPIFGFESHDPYGDHYYLVTLCLQEEAVSAVTLQPRPTLI